MKKKDITEKDITKRYQAFLSLSSEAIWRFDLKEPIDIQLPLKNQIDLIYKYAYLAECNDAMARMYGLKKASEIEGKRLDELLLRNKENVTYLTNFIKNKYRLVDAASVEVDTQGQEKYFLNNLFGVIKKGKIYSAWGTQRDITEQKKIEQTLLYQAQTLESVTDALITVDMKYRIQSWNKGAEKLYGWKTREVMYKYIYDIIPATFSSGSRASSLEHMLKKGSWSGEVKQSHKDGRILNISGIASLIKNSKGEAVGIVAVNRDITERVEQERRKDEFISMASHELKTPVTSLKLYTQLLQKQIEKKGKEAVSVSLTKMNAQINRLSNLISDLLDISKIQTGKLEFRNDHFSLQEVIADITESLQAVSDHTIIVKDNGKVTLFGDRDRIAQVIINLLTNAIKYSPETSNIVISIYKGKDSVEVSIRDYGIGIAKKDQEKIFDRFYQVTSENRGPATGLGIGLYISNEIIKRYQGKMWVNSSLGKGTTFTFSLPYSSKKK